jgi:hypothetical protein
VPPIFAPCSKRNPRPYYPLFVPIAVRFTGTWRNKDSSVFKELRQAAIHRNTPVQMTNQKVPHARSSGFNLFIELTHGELHRIGLNFRVLVSVTVSVNNVPAIIVTQAISGSG